MAVQLHDDDYRPQVTALYPHQHLGLRRNPFGSLDQATWAQLVVIPNAIEAAFAEDTHLLLLGDKGHGKTSILLALTQYLRHDGQRVAYERLAVGQRRPQTQIAALDAFTLDEAQRLAFWRWWYLLRQAHNGTRLLIGSHINHARLFQLAQLPVSVFNLSHLVDKAHAARVHRRRIAYFTFEDATPLTLTDDAIDALWSHCGSDLRAQGNRLYNVIQTMTTPQPITAALLQSNGIA